ncbi:MAG: hypothetical protein J6R34_00545 [Clostridia bacterium]|jgi:hypothetical protein|nr:hypothetical protein [Clostridia bacterium]
MEKIFFVRNDYLDFVNEELKKGARVKMISACSEIISDSAYDWKNRGAKFGMGRELQTGGGSYAYIVLVYPD